jgi:hypothetical protein
LVSITTAAPESATYLRLVILSYCFRAVMIALRNWASTEAWIRASIVVTRVAPGTGAVCFLTPVVYPTASTITSLTPGVPRRSLSYVRSTPARPTRSERCGTESPPDFSMSSSSSVVIGDR